MNRAFLPLRFFFLSLLLIGASTAFAQVSPFSFEIFKDAKGDSMIYRQLVSDYAKDAKYPLVVFLHGAGERGNDNNLQLKWGVEQFASPEIMKMYRPIVIAPQCPKEMTWDNFSEKENATSALPSKSMQLLMELIDQTIQNLPVDTSRIYITGLSMGAYGVFEAIARYPSKFAAAVPVCGTGDTALAPLFAHVPIWMFQGALDPAVDAAAARQMLEKLSEAGAKPGYTQYPETGHFAWLAAFSDKMMMQWLFSQKLP